MKSIGRSTCWSHPLTRAFIIVNSGRDHRGEGVCHSTINEIEPVGWIDKTWIPIVFRTLPPKRYRHQSKPRVHPTSSVFGEGFTRSLLSRSITPHARRTTGQQHGTTNTNTVQNSREPSLSAASVLPRPLPPAPADSPLRCGSGTPPPLWRGRRMGRTCLLPGRTRCLRTSALGSPPTSLSRNPYEGRQAYIARGQESYKKTLHIHTRSQVHFSGHVCKGHLP